MSYQTKVLRSIVSNWYFVGCLNVSHSSAFQYTCRRRGRSRKTPFFFTRHRAFYIAHRTYSRRVEIEKEMHTHFGWLSQQHSNSHAPSRSQLNRYVMCPSISSGAAKCGTQPLDLTSENQPMPTWKRFGEIEWRRIWEKGWWHSQWAGKKLLQHFKQVSADKFQYIDNVMNVLECVRIDITNRLLLTAFSNYRIVLFHNTIHFLLLPFFHSLFGFRWFGRPFSSFPSLFFFFPSLQPTNCFISFENVLHLLADFFVHFFLSQSLSHFPSIECYIQFRGYRNICTIVHSSKTPREKRRAEKCESMKISIQKSKSDIVCEILRTLDSFQ